MRRALALARRGWGQTAPNPMVGAVVVRGDEVVGDGYHARYGEAHAEVNALRAAGDRARGATVYVTLEPCAHFGKTPPCVDALIAAGVARVVAATADDSAVARGGGERLRSAGVRYETGVEEAAARELNAPFFHALRDDRPWATLKLATSIDGAIAAPGRRGVWLTGPAARREVHHLRAGSDAVAVGIGTALADDPLLTVREAPPPRVAPLRVVFDREARLPLTSRMVRTARETPTVVVASRPDARRRAALEASGVDVLVAGTLGDGLRELRGRGVRSLLVEGGATIASALVGNALAHRLIIFQAPVILGADAVAAFAAWPGRPDVDLARLVVVERRTVGDDFMSVYALQSPPCSPV
ncbi:MAG TPA: bifunctional diaminohydroxyphosphoribosylaminopyrimidine deaminase/5-amino-6-(5-phosphoribosylamino)uracil reductase RibD [Gemmatimonadaceae bacterium]|nr:bifunctional diaminohydroxyphosphoribosylaminopyrimidine deaminase/5-amino-6-(5-phosphoribosylamino)uracil reductase RibD [Gemmatimonadaceae bacterium]